MKNFIIVNDIKDANAVTHNGKFHIDEVFGTILLIKIFEKISLARVSEINDSNSYNNKIIFDIGKGEFDHHQSDALTREDGIKYSSFGLLWKKYGKKYLKKIKCEDIDFAWKHFDNSIVKTIDKIDNFQIEKDCLKNYMISNIIENFNPTWDSNTDSNIMFEKALDFANVIFDNEIANVLAIIKANNYLKNINIDNEEYIVLEKFIPYNDFINENDKKGKINFIVFPSKRKGYEIRTILDRKRFPKDWYNLSENDFFIRYNIHGMLYCHSNGKLCIADNLETVKKIINLT